MSSGLLDDPTALGEVTVGGDTDASASRTSVTARAPATGDVIGRYVVLDVVGTGGMGVVLAAYDPQLDRKVALKLVRPDRAADRGEIEREARTIARLRHPNLVTVHDVGTTEAGVFLAMEFIDGVTLREWQRADRTWREIVDVYGQAARGLAAAHEAGVVHGDFKPENVFVGSLGGKPEVKLLDFGLARVAGHEPELPADPASWTPAGTLAYMSPERIAGGAASAAGDEFAFCVALFEALAGHRPYDLETLASSSRGAAVKATTAPWRPSAGAPQWLRALVLRGVSLQAAARWASMRELAQALERGPGRARRRALVVAGTAIGMGALAVAMAQTDPCAEAGADIRVASIDRAREAGEDAELIARVDDQALRYAADLVDAAYRGCTATLAGDTLLARRRERCIDQGLMTLQVWGEALEAGDEDGRRAVVVEALGWEPPVACADDAALLLEPEPPAEIDRDRALVHIGTLARTTLSHYVPTFETTADSLDALVVDLREVGDRALLAEALYRRGQVATRLGDVEHGYEWLLDGLESAEAAGATRLQVQIWLTIADNRHIVDTGEGLERLAIERAAAAATRLGSPPGQVAGVAVARGLLAVRTGDAAAAQTHLEEAIAIASAAGSLRQVIAARISLTIVLLRRRRIDDAVASGELVVAAALGAFGPAHPESGVALGSYAAALAAARRFSDAREATRRSLEVLDRWGRWGASAANGVACNWCSGVALACMRDEVVAACKACIDRALPRDNVTPGVTSGASAALHWIADIEPDAAIEPAVRMAARTRDSPAWSKARDVVALALRESDPVLALAIANDACPAADTAGCRAPANLVVAELEPDPRRRREAYAALLAWWRAKGPDERSEWLGVGLVLAKAGDVPTAELAAAARSVVGDCSIARDAVDAWLATAPSATSGK